MGISERSVRMIEERAFAKLRRHPLLKAFWREWQGGEIEEAYVVADWRLSQSEIAAIYAMAKTTEERRVLRKVMELITRS